MTPLYTAEATVKGEGRSGGGLFPQRGVDESAVALVVDLHRFVEQTLLVPESGVDAGDSDAQRATQIAGGRGLVTALPEQQDRLVQGRVAVEGAGPSTYRGHSAIL